MIDAFFQQFFQLFFVLLKNNIKSLFLDFSFDQLDQHCREEKFYKIDHNVLHNKFSLYLP